MDARAEMDRLQQVPAEEVCHHLAMRVRQARRANGVSQARLALKAGIPLRTYKRFEVHGKGTLETFVKVLRALDRTHYLILLFPVSMPRRQGRAGYPDDAPSGERGR